MFAMRNSLAMIAVLAMVGCGGTTTTDTAKKDPKGAAAKAPDKPTPTAKTEPAKVDDHSGWWCDEHGVVEEECSMCQGDVFKKLKPDQICKKHPDRAKDQCFICHPELREKNAAKYRAKFDKDPPEPTENMPEKK